MTEPVATTPAVSTPVVSTPAASTPAAPASTPSAPATEPETAAPTAPADGSVVDTVIDAVVDVVGGVVDAVSNAASSAADAVADAVKTVVDMVTGVDRAELQAPLIAVSQPASTSSVPSPAEPTAPSAVPPAVETLTQPTSPADGLTPEVGEMATNPGVRQFSVSNLTELRAALSTALTVPGGAEIRLQPGNYGSLVWTSKAYKLGRVKLLAATSVRPVFTHMNLSSSSGMAISGMQISSSERAAVYLNSTRDIIFAGNVVTSVNRNSDPWDDGNSGIHVRFAERVTLTGNLLEDLRGGVYFQQSSKVTFEYNTLRHIREGINVAATDDLDLYRNYFHSFSPKVAAGEHPDSIQFWTSREKVGSSHVKIIENVMAHGGCAAVQGIFIRSETEGKNIPQIRHTDFTIRGNVYFGASKNGLSMSSIDGAVAENNVVIASPYSETGVSRADAQKKDPRCSGALKPALLSRFGTTSHMIRNNIVSQLGTSDGSQSNNITVSTTGTTVWTEVFRTRPTGATPALSVFLTKNPSAARTQGVGVLASYAYGATLTARQALERALEVHKS
ncbi:right-handed parallel beta-helix repeat-containing protein [Sandaracinobacteroides hominis]|uniref:right-handed parallel beta-helix repeat-containing protein n=1 Tax=Sandaracinobacteroides hominis TaxID=2780086 RepID=UPI0018F3F42F|nr:right-handed parallel beta-helix repeat-containing protein [Sandaracinobacteroides hominis]